MSKFKVQVDKDKCIGCGTCVAICPGNFKMGSDGKSIPIKKEVEGLGCNQMAAESCPTQAIKVDPVK